ncbi:hypothetical protein [Veronia pacifica]|uniref:hypothetical protein n=1 Tax=Veronia pacifica TaxID=1080227 RepID=UPI001112FFC9|nr:hypothetical protein [Veronia pacifica]
MTFYNWHFKVYAERLIVNILLTFTITHQPKYTELSDKLLSDTEPTHQGWLNESLKKTEYLPLHHLRHFLQEFGLSVNQTTFP